MSMPPVRSEPAWLNPPAGVLPGVAPVAFVLGRGPDVAVTVTGVAAYPIGIGFRLHLRFRSADTEPGGVEEALFEPHWEVRGGVPGHDATLRFGIELADGRGATNLDRRPFDLPPGVLPAGPVLSQGGGSGGGGNWDSDYWLWPLPPEGPLTFTAEWPSQGVPPSRVTIDTAPLRAAAARAAPLWPG